MPLAPTVPKDVIASAAQACKGSRERFAMKDYTITPAEGDAYLALLRAAKEAGIPDPFAGVVADSLPEALGHWRHRSSPIRAR